MDGDLSADERYRVEQLLESDPQASSLFASLKESSSLLRRSLENGPGLGSGFADRVMAATFSEAESSGLAADHPVRLAANDRRSESHEHFSRWKLVGTVGLAASLIAAALFYWRPSDQVRPIAENNAAAATMHGSDANANVTPQVDGSAGRVEVALTEPAGQNDSGSANSSVPTVDRTIERRAGADSRLASDDLPARPSIDTIASPGESINPPGDRPATADALPSIGEGNLRAMMVYEVFVSVDGRKNNVVGRVFRDCGIDMNDERQVDDTLVGFLRDGGIVSGIANDSVPQELAGADQADSAERCQLIFLEGSGLKLEKAMLELLGAEGEVSKVGFKILMDPPVFAAIDRLKQIDPTAIRAADATTTVAQPLNPQGFEGQGGGFLTGQRSFQPLGRDQLEMMNSLSGYGDQDANDITSQVLVVIRFAP
jgi:hypothetical protein